MSKRRWFRPEAEPAEGSVISFRRQVLGFLSLFIFYSTWWLILWSNEVPVALGPSLAVIGGGLALSALVWLLRRDWPRVTSWLGTVGLFLQVAGIVAWFKQPLAPAFLALPILVAGVLLGTTVCVVIALGAAAWMILFSLGTPQVGWILPWTALYIGTAGVALLAGRGLHLADYWERELALRQEEMVVSLRERQGELNRTLKALDEAYVSLKRSKDELALARQEAEEARTLKEQFVANVSHELRTPLNLIVGFAEMMYLSPDSYDGVVWTPDLIGDVEELYRASRHLQSLVNDILDLSRIDAARLPMYREVQDIRPILTEALETIAPLLRQRGLSCRVDWPAELPPLFVDRTRIRQVMLNLLNNAVRFTDVGSITVRVRADETAVQVCVEDTGIGIPSNQLEHIFEVFRQVDAKSRDRGGGAGLGLALSRQFIELHGGRMWAESELGRGSRFYFSLPLPGTTPQTVGLQRIGPKRRLEAGGEPVVLVEPDASIAEMLARYLGDRPVIPAHDGQDVQRLVEEHHPVAVVVNLPPDASLEEWLGPASFAAQHPSLPIWRCSIPSTTWLQRSTGLNDCLTKPISQETLRRVVQHYCPQPGKVLVVDDDPGFVRLVGRMLEVDGLAQEVLTAYNGAHALRLARERMPQLVLLDLLMPGMDGFEVLAAIREDPHLAALPVVAVTATSYAEEILLRKGSYLTLTQMAGISTGSLAEVFRAVLPLVRPNYVAEPSLSKT
jgi:signal transduction histidine kinase/CheY-like chemotaxis protein